MQKLFETLTVSFRKNGGELSFASFERIVKRDNSFLDSIDTTFLLLQASGYPIEESISGYRLKSCFTPYQEQIFTVVDVETNGSKPNRSQIIELGAVKIRDGIVIDRLESFLFCTYLPENISLLTGIEAKDLLNAPDRRDVLERFRFFLEDTIFVAHDASFDYGFLNASFERFGLGSIGNQVLCTIDLAKRTIESPKYGLAFLNKFFSLNMDSHHRAYSDALATSKILQISLKNLPKSIKSSDELILFSKS